MYYLKIPANEKIWKRKVKKITPYWTLYILLDSVLITELVMANVSVQALTSFPLIALKRVLSISCYLSGLSVTPRWECQCEPTWHSSMHNLEIWQPSTNGDGKQHTSLCWFWGAKFWDILYISSGEPGQIVPVAHGEVQLDSILILAFPCLFHYPWSL